MNRELVRKEGKKPHGTATLPHTLRHSHDRTSPSIHDFLAGGKGDSQLWKAFAGAIHNLDPSIHNLVHNFWQGKGSNGEIFLEIAILTVRSPALRLFLPITTPHHHSRTCPGRVQPGHWQWSTTACRHRCPTWHH